MARKKTWVEKNLEKYSEYTESTSATILDLMKNQKNGFQMPLEVGKTGQGLPYNGSTGASYRGINAQGLFAAQQENRYNDNRWFTFKQKEDLGYRLRKGEKGTKAVKWVDIKDKKGAQEDQNKNKNEGEDDDDQKSQRKMPVPFTVFNGEQLIGLPPPDDVKLRSELEVHEDCERILQESGATIHHGGSRAYYNPATDEIFLPEKGQFESDSAYYATALHELSHWTGHESRLNRDLSGEFGSEAYAREELRAEIASYMIGQHIGVGHDPSRQAAYLNSWIKLLEDDPKAILKATADAEKILDTLGVQRITHEATQKAEKEATNEATQEAKVESTRTEDKVAAIGIPSSSPTHAHAKQEEKRQRTYDSSMGMSM